MIKKFSEYIKEIEDKHLLEMMDYDLSEDEMMFEMANLLPSRTGLKYQVWYSAKVERHKPRIKVDLGDGKALSIQIEDHKVIDDTNKISSKDLNDVFKWIDINKDALIRYWNEASEGKIDTIEMSKLLKSI